MTLSSFLLQTTYVPAFPAATQTLLDDFFSSIASAPTGLASIRDILWYHTFAIARVLATFALTLRIIMAGFSIMFGQGARTFSDQFFDIIIKGVLLWFFVFSGTQGLITDKAASGTNSSLLDQPVLTTAGGLPIAQSWLVSACESMANAGKELAAQLGAPIQTPGLFSSKEPPLYWADFIMGQDPLNPTPGQSRFSFKWIIHNMFGWDQGYEAFAKFMKWLAYASLAAVGGAAAGTATNSQGLTMASSLVLGFGFSTFVGIFAVGLLAFGTVMGLLIAALLSWLGSLIAPYLSFYIVLCLGVAVLPLIFFKRFESLWVQYSVFLTGAMLCIFFYYVTSAFGYFLATETMSELFIKPMPTDLGGAAGSGPAFFATFWGVTNNSNLYTNTTVMNPSNVGVVPTVNLSATNQFSALLTCLKLLPFYDAISSEGLTNGTSSNIMQASNNFDVELNGTLHTIFSGLEGTNNTTFSTSDVIAGVQTGIQAILAEGAWAAGIGILAAIISGGIVLSAVGPVLAFSWEKAFTSQEMIGKFQEFFQKVSGAAQSGMRGIANSASQRLQGAGSMISQTGRGIVSSLSNRLNS